MERYDDAVAALERTIEFDSSRLDGIFLAA
jgi:hypothetical protein